MGILSKITELLNTKTTRQGAIATLGAVVGASVIGAEDASAEVATCPNGKTEFCPEGCFCEDQVCKRCPKNYALRPSGRCKCAIQNEDNCKFGRFAKKQVCRG